MKNLRKIVSMLMIAALICLCLIGCQKSAETSGDSSASSSDEVTIEGIKKEGVLHVVTEVAFEPFEYYDTDGTTVIGYGKDILDYIVADLGVTLDQQDLPWQGCLPALEANKCDLLATSVTCTKERSEKYSLTLPIADSTVVLIKRADDDSIKTIDDMEGKIVGCQNGSGQCEALEKYNEKVKAAGKTGYGEEKLYTSFPEAYLELKNGVIDLVAQSVSNANVLVKNNPGVYEIVGEIGDKTYFTWALRKDETELTDFINDEIRKMKENGKLAELQEKWFGVATDLPEEGYVPES